MSLFKKAGKKAGRAFKKAGWARANPMVAIAKATIEKGVEVAHEILINKEAPERTQSTPSAPNLLQEGEVDEQTRMDALRMNPGVQADTPDLLFNQKRRAPSLLG